MVLNPYQELKTQYFTAVCDIQPSWFDRAFSNTTDRLFLRVGDCSSSHEEMAKVHAQKRDVRVRRYRYTTNRRHHTAVMVILVGQKDWIEDVVVDKCYRRQGIASRLVDMAEGISRRRNAKSINLTSKPDREGARRMYGDRGYNIWGTSVFRKTF